MPGCTLPRQSPKHKMPTDVEKAYAWLRIIGRTDKIGKFLNILYKFPV